MSISGLGPHGEHAAAPGRVDLGEADIAAARGSKFRVAVVLHTTASDWAKRQLAGIVATLDRCETTITAVIDGGFAAEGQIAALETLHADPPDAVIAIPVANARVAQVYRRIAQAGIRLLLLDNVPTGLLPGSDYVTLVSADNFGLGSIAAAFLAARIARNGTIGIVSYDSEFVVTNEREIAFDKWMRTNRPDIRLCVRKFDSIQSAGNDALALLAAEPDLSGLFVVWDTPAMEVIGALKRIGRHLPVSTIDLGQAAALELAGGGMICGIGAQQPYLQGVAVAQACVLAMLGKPTPAWIALPGLPVSRENVAEQYRHLAGEALHCAQRV